MYLVTHADQAFGGRVAARLLCGGDAVRAHVSARGPSRQLNKLRTGGAEVIRGDLYGALTSSNTSGSTSGSTLDKRLWREVTGVVHAPVTATTRGKEVVMSVSDLDAEAMVYQALAVRVRQLVLLSAPSQTDLRALLAHSGLEYALLHPHTPEAELDLGGGTRGRLLERRRQIFFLPLQGVADVAVFTASAGLKHVLLRLPTEARRYHNVVDQVERLLRLPECPLADALLAELLMGSPYKLVTPGVARVLGLTFGPDYVAQVFAQPLEG